MIIINNETGEIIARHKISKEKGKLIPINLKERDLNNNQEIIYNKTFSSLLYLDEAMVKKM